MSSHIKKSASLFLLFTLLSLSMTACHENPTDSPRQKESIEHSDASFPAEASIPEIVVQTEVLPKENSLSPLHSASSPSKQTPIRLAFCGDILLSEHVLQSYDAAGDASGILSEDLLEAGRNADLFIANQEFPFGTSGTPAPDKQFTFRVRPERSAILNELGIDLVTLANNHTLDYGRSCLFETFETLSDASIDYMGAGSDLNRAMERKTYEIKGKKIGFLAASRVIPDYSWNAGENQSGLFTTYDSALLLREIRRAEEECDFTVVYVHWGLERHTEPEAYQTSLAESYIDAGADLVIGAHPHVLQPLSFYRGVPIAYSLGNYLFGSSIPETMLLLADIFPDGEVRLSKIPATSKNGKTVSTGEEMRILSQ